MTTRPKRTCRLTLPAEPASLDEVHDSVQSLWAEQAGFPAADRMRFETAVIEVAGNIVAHATDGLSSKVAIELTLTATPDSVTASFRDDGGAAELDLASTQMPDPTAESGRGLALTRTLADDFTYERAGATNIWKLICRRTGPARPWPQDD
jgi:serine/threonine-protein kinase RsbW